MSASQGYYVPEVLNAGEDIDLEEVRESLLEEVPEDRVEEKNSHVQYSGSRFEFVFWEKSVIFRDYIDDSADREDLYAWQEFADWVEEDLKYPPE